MDVHLSFGSYQYHLGDDVVVAHIVHCDFMAFLVGMFERKAIKPGCNVVVVVDGLAI